MALCGVATSSAAAELAEGAVRALARTPKWSELSMDGKEEKCIRDESLVVRAVGEMLRRKSGDQLHAEARAWGRLHLLPFLGDQTKLCTGPLLTHLNEFIGARFSDHAISEQLRSALSAVYGVETEEGAAR